MEIVVANAVTSSRKSFLETDVASLKRTLDVALFGNFYVCQLAARRMAEAEASRKHYGDRLAPCGLPVAAGL